MRSILASFPTEKLILHKPSGDTYEVEGLVESSGIQSEDINVPIEPNDYFERSHITCQTPAKTAKKQI